MKQKVLGRLVGNTGDPNKLLMIMASSFAARRGEFVRMQHKELPDEPEVSVLGRINSISRSNILYNPDLGGSLSDLELLPGAQVTGERIVATIELVGFKDPISDQIKIPRRPINPGTIVETVDFQFLSAFYEFDEQTSLHIGNLVGYERGENIVPAFIDINTLVTEHLAILAMTGAGKSYTVGRIIERLVTLHNGTVVVFDPHGEYGRAFADGRLHFNPALQNVEDPRDRETLPEIQRSFERLANENAGISVYTPQSQDFRNKYAGQNMELALQLDHFEMDDLGEVIPGLSEPQQRVLDITLRYWQTQENEPRNIESLRQLLGPRLDEVRNWPQLTPQEADALNTRSANIVAMRLSRLINEAQSFFSPAVGRPTNIYEMIGRRTEQQGRLVIVDLQGLSDTAKQVITALLSTEILSSASNPNEQTRPCFIVYEEGHSFAPAGGKAISHRIIKKVAGEGRKFGVGFAIVSQRPSKLDPDVTSQCNTLITMRLKNPDDQRFIAKTSDMVGQADLAELPSLSTGEALISGRSIPAPLLVRIGSKALLHGGASPEVLNIWGGAARVRT